MKVEDEILKIRKIKENSLKAYMIILKKLNDNKVVDNLDFLLKKDNVMKLIDEKALTTRRNYLGAILVALPIVPESEEVLDFYKEKLSKVNEQYSDKIATHEKSESQEKNWSSLEELRDVYLEYKKQIKKDKYLQKEKLDSKEFNYLTNYLIVSLYTLMPPIRLDYIMKVIDKESDDDDKHNFLLNKSRNTKMFIINEYKSSKSYGKIKLKIPSELNSIINLYLKFHKDKDNFILNSRGSGVTANNLGKMITNAFSKYINKKITLNLLRHIYISENVTLAKDSDDSKLANKMQHSTSTQQKYIKV